MFPRKFILLLFSIFMIFLIGCEEKEYPPLAGSYNDEVIDTISQKEYPVIIKSFLPEWGYFGSEVMIVGEHLTIISHVDDEIRLLSFSIDSYIDYCLTYARDMQTGQRYLLIDRIGIE